MRVLITTDLYKPQINGVVTSVLNLYEELKKLGVDVKILTLSRTNKSYIEGDVYFVRSFPVRVYPDVRASVSIRDKVLKDAIEWKPDIIHTQCEFSTLIFAKIIAKKVRCPMVHTYHTMYEYYVKYLIKNEVIGKKLVSRIIKNLLGKSDHIIAPTEKVKRSLQKFNIKKDISVIPTGIDLSKFDIEVSSEELLDLKKKIGIKEDDFVCLFLGRVAEEKNIDEIIDNFIEINKERKDVSLLIVGGGPYYERLIEKTNKLKCEKIYFTGMVSPDEVHKYYKLADLFVCASQSETQGLTYIEAMANQLALVCRYDDCLESILIDGQNGYFFDEPEDFKNKIIELLENREKLKKFSNEAKKTSMKYSKKYFAETVYELYKYIISSYIYIPMHKKKFKHVKMATINRKRKMEKFLLKNKSYSKLY